LTAQVRVVRLAEISHPQAVEDDVRLCVGGHGGTLPDDGLGVGLLQYLGDGLDHPEVGGGPLLSRLCREKVRLDEVGASGLCECLDPTQKVDGLPDCCLHVFLDADDSYPWVHWLGRCDGRIKDEWRTQMFV
jgi:hypothetical protein